MESGKHFLILPYPAFGHITPMLELGKKIAQKHRVTLCLSAQKLPAVYERKLLPAKNIEVAALDDGITDDCDKDLSPHIFQQVMTQLQTYQHKLFMGLPTGKMASEGPVKVPVTGVIMDSMFVMSFQVCHKLGLDAYMFSCPAALMTASGMHIDENTPVISDEYMFKPNPEQEKELERLIREGNDYKPDPAKQGIPAAFKDMCLMMLAAYPLVKAVVVNSFEDLEQQSKAIFEEHPKSGGTKMKFVGPLFPEQPALNDTEQQVKEWLDRQVARSVIFVSFGSMAMPIPEQIPQIAEALIALNKPFIWSLRKEQHHHLPQSIRDKLDNQFSGNFLILPWAPQKLILGHEATQVFVSHCGWNSSLETIYSGVPVVAWPMFADQFMNADFLTAIGVAYKLENTSVKAFRVVPKDEIEGAISKVASGENRSEDPSKYFIAAQVFSKKAKEALSEHGKSTRDFNELFG